MYGISSRSFAALTKRPVLKLLLHGAALASLTVITPASLLYADGFRNPFQSAAAIGQATAFAAQADDPSAIHYNPAGMTQLSGVQFAGGVQFLAPHTSFTSPAGTVTRDRNGATALPPPGQVFITARIQDLGIHSLGDLSIGIGVESLFGFAVKYPETGPFNSAITSASLPLLDIKPTLAYRVSDWLALGLGADIFTFASFVGEGHIEQQFVWPGGQGIPPGTPVEVNGSGTTVGMNASFLVTPLRNDQGQPLLNVGGVWRSQAVVPLTGELRANGALVADLQSSLRLPEMYHLAVAGWPVRTQEREWKFETDVDFVRWQSIREANVYFSNGGALLAPQRLHNAVSIALGTEHKWTQIEGFTGWSVALRGGYLWSQRAYSAYSFHPRIPDANSHSLSMGIGMMCRGGGTFLGLITCSSPSEAGIHLRGIGLDLAYQSIFDETRTIAGNLNPTLDGTYRSSMQIGTFTLRLLL